MQTITDWLKTFPLWEGTLYTDYTEPGPGSSGLFSLGTEELERKQDLLGNIRIRCRRKWELRRKTPGRGAQKDALWILQLEEWIRKQSAEGAAPTFGNAPREEVLRAERGGLAGPGVYSLTITAEFTRIFPAM